MRRRSPHPPQAPAQAHVRHCHPRFGKSTPGSTARCTANTLDFIHAHRDSKRHDKCQFRWVPALRENALPGPVRADDGRDLLRDTAAAGLRAFVRHGFAEMVSLACDRAFAVRVGRDDASWLVVEHGEGAAGSLFAICRLEAVVGRVKAALSGGGKAAPTERAAELGLGAIGVRLCDASLPVCVTPARFFAPQKRTTSLVRGDAVARFGARAAQTFASACFGVAAGRGLRGA